ncbi:nitrite/sulfite reductase [Variovorax sp. PCZ-1]|uniref:nitrite/sulfite reductase n=1 Tax=Variovorax sp. PCZ-1 TaxID=2835533 RepID=UPI001BCD0734|nr:nitrite/sulfite reductase [Variovorax sp. PCZ-1]MBS7806842.1 nitrite/sulfite reductase [Variovorax sp. PCZ-1]
MYTYNNFDKEFVKLRAAQYRDQLERRLDGRLKEEEFRPLRLQNGWYVQRYAPMLRVAVPYGELNTAQLRVLAQIAREYDQPSEEVFQAAVTGQARLSGIGIELTKGYGHFTTRQNIQYNWIPLEKSADVMDLLATVNMHGIQTSGNCIRNITSDGLAGIAPDEIADPRPFCEILRQWSTLHPEFAFLPRKFKIAVTGAEEDRAATDWHDVGLKLVKAREDDAANGIARGDLGFQVLVGGGMGRTPVIATKIREFLPWNQILNYLEAIVRVYNLFGRRDNKYKARIKILVKAEGQKYIDAVESEYQNILTQDGAPHTITQAELDRVSKHFVPPAFAECALSASDFVASKVSRILEVAAHDDVAFTRWLTRNVHAHKNPKLRAVTLSVKRVGQSPGDVTPEQMEAAAQIADQFSAGEIRVTHDQNLLLPWVSCDALPELWRAAKKAGFASSNIGLLSDMIACPGGDFCDLANARSLPIAQELTERYQDLDELEDIGDIDLHMSGCINSCGHHHSGHIGILGVDKDGQEWYQLTLGGSDGSKISGASVAGKVVGPSFSAAEIPDAIEAVLKTYKQLREPRGEKFELFIDTLKRLGAEPFKAAANGARHKEEAAA